MSEKDKTVLYWLALYQLADVEGRPGWDSVYYLYDKWSKEHKEWWIRYIEREAKKGMLPMATILTQEVIRQRLMN